MYSVLAATQSSISRRFTMHVLTAFLSLALIAAPTLAHADGITFQVSIVGSGNVGTTPFTNERITLSSYLSYQALYQYGQTSTPQNFYFDNGIFSNPNLALFTTGSIEGIGSFDALGLYSVQGSDGMLDISDNDFELGIDAPFSITNFYTPVGPTTGTGGLSGFPNGTDCSGIPFSTACPGYLLTSLGDVYINSWDDDSATSQMIVTSVTPEPSAFVLFGTGMAALTTLRRRRFR
jgi:hypothetical protein